MKLGKIAGRAWKMYRAHLGDYLRGTLAQVIVCMIVAAPLLFLSQKETAGLALLTPVLFLLLVLPMRQNAAAAMRRSMEGERFATPELVSFAQYGIKLGRGLKEGLFLALWGLPCIAVTVAFMMAYNGMVDVFTLVRFFMSLGGGKFTKGIVVGVAIYAVTILLALIGMALCSWRRHGYAWGLPGSAVKGHRGQLFALNLLGALTFVPFGVVVAIITHGYASQLIQALSGLTSGSMSLPPLTGNLWLVGAAFVVLFLPLLPFKSLLPAAFTEALKIEEGDNT